MTDHKPLDILDADNIDFNTQLEDEDIQVGDTITEEHVSVEDEEMDETGETDDPIDETDTKADVEPNEMATDEPGILYNLMHLLDDLYVYGRTVIENNYFNLADNADFNLVYPNIYIGNYSTSTNLELLTGLGITHVITVLPTFNPPFPDKLKYHHVPAYDDESQNLETNFQGTTQFISDVLTNRGKLLIHCMVGRSRSVSFFMAFLIHVIQGGFNQSAVDTTSSNDVSNEIEYNKFSGKQSVLLADGVSAVRYNKRQQDSDDNTEGAGASANGHEEISRLEYQIPKLGGKYRTFMNYKKDTMIIEIRNIAESYNNGKNTDKIYDRLLAYVKKYRAVACPNTYFEKQLRMLLEGQSK
jgi:hypothetical protein